MDRPDPLQAGGTHESFIRILLADVIAALERYKAGDSQMSRRDVVRTAFSAIEGLTWTYRQHVLAAAEGTGIVTGEEKAALAELNYQVTEQGRIASQPRYVSVPATIRLTTRIATKLHPDLNIEFGTDDWNSLRHAIAVRNRIMHPKRPEDLHIDDADIAKCTAAFFWLLDVMTLAMDAANAALNAYAKGARMLLKKLKDGDPETLADYQAAAEAISKAAD